MKKILPLLFLIPVSNPYAKEPLTEPSLMCPSYQACVSSKETDSKKYIPPLGIDSTGENLWKNLRLLLYKEKNATLSVKNSNHIRIEYKSKIFRFRDFVDVVRDPKTGVIDWRSHSQFGYLDFGVNRNRLERISKSLLKK